MKKTLIICLLSFFKVSAQTTLLTAGGNTSGSNGNISYSIGEIIYNTNIGSNFSIAQGVQHPYEIQNILGLNNVNINLDLAVYPNPTTDKLVLDVKNLSLSNLSYQLFDYNGRIIYDKKINSETTMIMIEHLPSSIFLLKVLQNNKELKVFKIIKK